MPTVFQLILNHDIMETFYHGTSALFKKFDLARALEGAGKVKFGYGVYVTYNSKGRKEDW